MPRRAGVDAPAERAAADIAEQIAAELRRVGTPERAAQQQRYLKSEMRHLGATVPAIRRAARDATGERGALDRPTLLALVRRLWASGVFDLRLAAAVVLERHVGLLRARDIALLEELLRDSRTWALVDNIAVNAVGPLVEAHPDLGATLDRWAADGDLWIRRSALLALLRPLRREGGSAPDFERFARYADAMLEEREFFIRKAIGWVAREAGRRDPARVVAWLEPRIGRASGVTVREAVKHLPAADRERLLAAYRARGGGRGPRRGGGTLAAAEA
jgi:3-methyladenine DNA glycosylase AlkD